MEEEEKNTLETEKKKKKLKKPRAKNSEIQFRASQSAEPPAAGRTSTASTRGRKSEPSKHSKQSQHHHHHHHAHSSKSKSKSRSSHHRHHKPSPSVSPIPNPKHPPTQSTGTELSGKFSDTYKIIAHDKHQPKKFVHIHRCQHLTTNKIFSVKIVNTVSVSRWNKRLPFFQEPSSLALWSKLSPHPNICPLHQWFIGQHHTYFITDECISFSSTKTLREALAMDDASGLQQSPEWTVLILKQITQGLQYLHEKNEFVHGDLRPDHAVLVQSQPQTEQSLSTVQVMLKGLGACAKFNEPASAVLLNRPSSHYIAPEFKQRHHHHTKTCALQPALDIWSLGVVAFFLMAARLPPHPESAANGDAYQLILETDALWKNPHVSKQAKDFVLQCLQWDNTKRWNVSQALAHPFLNGETTALHGSLKKTKGPNLRASTNANPSDSQDTHVRVSQTNPQSEQELALPTRQEAPNQSGKRLAAIEEKSSTTSATADSSGEEFVLEIVESTDEADQHGNNNQNPIEHAIDRSKTTARTTHARQPLPKHPQNRSPLRLSSINFTGHKDHDKFYKKYRLIQNLGPSMASSSSTNQPKANERPVIEWYACRHRKTGVERTVKIVTKSSQFIKNDKPIFESRREFHTLASKELQHDKILAVQELFESDQHYFLVFKDAIKRNLKDEIDNWGPVSEVVAKQVMRQLLACVSYLHDTQGEDDVCWVHHKIRPETIVLLETSDNNPLQERNRIKLTGFGQATRYNPSTGELLEGEKRPAGGHPNESESEAKGDPGFLRWVDVYACGKIAQLILDWDGISELGKKFIQALLAEDLEHRLSAEAALDHPWITCSSRDDNSMKIPESAWYHTLAISRFNGEHHCSRAVKLLISSQSEINQAMKGIALVFQSMGLSLDDGFSKPKFQDAYHRFSGCTLGEHEVNDIFDRIDVEQCGVEGVEFVVACLNELNLLNTKALQIAYQSLVMRGHTIQNIADLCEMLVYFGSGSNELAHTMSKAFSAHGNGGVSLDDLQGILVRVAIEHCSELKIPHAIHDMRGAALVRCGKMESVTFSPPESASAGCTLMDDYQMGRYIKNGVYNCIRTSSGSKHILKIVDISHRASKADEILQEVAILQGLTEQPNVALVNDVFEDDASIYVVLENYGDGGCLSDELDSFGRLCESDASRFLRKLLECVGYLHEMNIVHRDLKPESIMMKRVGDIDDFKISDFSSATVVDPAVGLEGKCGTAGYMAPEVAKGRYGSQCDIWSVGVIAYLCLSKTFSFQLFINDVKHLVKTGKFAFVDPSWDSISSAAKEFIANLLKWDQDQRPSAKMALGHKWLREDRDLSPSTLETQSKDLSSLGSESAVMSKRMQPAAMSIVRAFISLKEEHKALDRILASKGLSTTGHLSKANVKEVFQSFFSKELSDEAIDDLFLRIDMHGVGHITYQDFFVAVLNEKGLIGAGKLVNAFSVLDADGSGLISLPHLKGALTSLAEVPLERLDEGAVSSLLECLKKHATEKVSPNGFLNLLLIAEGISAGQAGQSALDGIDLTRMRFIENKSQRLEDVYEIGSFVNEGLFGKVFYCTHKSTGEVRAVKVRKDTIWEETAQNIVTEVEVLKKLDHPNVIPVIDLFIESGHYCIVSNFMDGGDLCSELDENGAFSEERAAELLRHLLGVVHYLHQRKVLHRDLKPDNIMFPKSKNLDQFKLIDFARAAMCEEDERLVTVVTTPEYASPEVVSKCYGHKADVYACGVILYLCLSNAFPFDGDTKEQIYELIQEGEYVILEDVSDSCLDLVTQLLTYDEEYRPTASKALEHNWFKSMRPSVALTQEITMDVQEALDNLQRHQQVVAPSKLKQATHALIAAQGLLQREKEDIDRAFLAIDANHDGRLSKQEVQEGYGAYFGQTLSDEEVNQMFAQLDVDGTGFLEYSEFVVAAMNENELLSSGKLRRAFDVFDVDHSGTISKEDLKKVMEEALDKGKATNDDVVAQLIEQVDLDGDGLISFEEFTSMMLMSTG